MPPPKVRTRSLILFLATFGLTAAPDLNAQRHIPSTGWTNAPAPLGTGTLHSAGGTATIEASGEIGEGLTSDSGFFRSIPVGEGDEIRALFGYTSATGHSGLMVRDTNAPDAAFVFGGVAPDGNLTLVYRHKAGTAVQALTNLGTAGSLTWLRLVVGTDTVYFYKAPHVSTAKPGTWVIVAAVSVDLDVENENPEIFSENRRKDYGGLFVSHSVDNPATPSVNERTLFSDLYRTEQPLWVEHTGKVDELPEGSFPAWERVGVGDGQRGVSSMLGAITPTGGGDYMDLPVRFGRRPPGPVPPNTTPPPPTTAGIEVGRYDIFAHVVAGNDSSSIQFELRKGTELFKSVSSDFISERNHWVHIDTVNVPVNDSSTYTLRVIDKTVPGEILGENLYVDAVRTMLRPRSDIGDLYYPNWTRTPVARVNWQTPGQAGNAIWRNNEAPNAGQWAAGANSPLGLVGDGIFRMRLAGNELRSQAGLTTLANTAGNAPGDILYKFYSKPGGSTGLIALPGSTINDFAHSNSDALEIERIGSRLFFRRIIGGTNTVFLHEREGTTDPLYIDATFTDENAKVADSRIQGRTAVPAQVNNLDADALSDDVAGSVFDERWVIDADPDDDIKSVYDVFPGGDSDGDGLSDLTEFNLAPKTNPARTDTDGDGLDDYEEIHTYGTNPTLRDTDDDGLEDGFEVSLPYGFDPTKKFTVNDGVSDKTRWEIFEFDPDDGFDDLTDLLPDDFDNDGVSNRHESEDGTHAADVDDYFRPVIFNRLFGKALAVDVSLDLIEAGVEATRLVRPVPETPESPLPPAGGISHHEAQDGTRLRFQITGLPTTTTTADQLVVVGFSHRGHPPYDPFPEANYAVAIRIDLNGTARITQYGSELSSVPPFSVTTNDLIELRLETGAEGAAPRFLHVEVNHVAIQGSPILLPEGSTAYDGFLWDPDKNAATPGVPAPLAVVIRLASYGSGVKNLRYRRVIDPDRDDDGMPDVWEQQIIDAFPPYPTIPAVLPGAKPDADDLTNLEEYELGTNPTTPDTDGDGMRDDWEHQFGLDPLNAADGATTLNPDGTPTADLDGDGLSNRQEFEIGSRPDRISTAEDGFSDDWKHRWGFDLNVALDPEGDEDNDGLDNAAEFTAGSNPGDEDSDGDGLSDDWEVDNELNPLDPFDAEGDIDRDRVSNLDEFLAGTDPGNGGWQTLTVASIPQAVVNDFDELLSAPASPADYQIYRSGEVFADLGRPTGTPISLALTDSGLPAGVIPLGTQSQAKVWVGGANPIETPFYRNQRIRSSIPGGKLLLTSEEDPVAGVLSVFQEAYRRLDPTRSSLQRLAPADLESFRTDRIIGPLADGTIMVTGRPFEHGFLVDYLTGSREFHLSEAHYFQTRLFRNGRWMDLSTTGDQRHFFGVDANRRGDVLGIATSDDYTEWTTWGGNFVHLDGEIVLWRNGQWIYTGLPSLHLTTIHSDVHLEGEFGGVTFHPMWLDLAEDGRFTALVTEPTGAQAVRPKFDSEVFLAPIIPERAYFPTELIRWTDGDIVRIAAYPEHVEIFDPFLGYLNEGSPVRWPTFISNSLGDLAETWRQYADGSEGEKRFFSRTGMTWEIDPGVREVTSDGGLLYANLFVYWQVSDTDHDGMADDWESFHGLDMDDQTDESLDPDGDGLSNFVEYRLGTDPHDEDTDGDELADGWEHQFGFAPTTFDDNTLDGDGDGFDLREEFRYGSDPNDPRNDRDGDGIDDRFEILNLLNPDDGSDAGLDEDFDGLDNRYEARYRTNPRMRDTDRDGVIDSLELWGSPSSPVDESDHVEFGGIVSLSAGSEITFDIVVPNTLVREVTALVETGAVTYTGPGLPPDTTNWVTLADPLPAPAWDDFKVRVTLRPGAHYRGGTFTIPFALRESLGRTSLSEPAVRDDLIVSAALTLTIDTEITVSLSGDFNAVAEGGTLPVSAALVVPSDLDVSEVELYFDGNVVAETTATDGNPIPSSVTFSPAVHYRLGENFEITARAYDSTGRGGPLSQPVVVQVSALADSVDLDALPDYWEQAIVDFDPGDEFADVAQIQEGDDFDADGFSNLEEFLAHTDPTDPDSDDDGIYDGSAGKLDLVYSGTLTETLETDAAGSFTAWNSSGLQTTPLTPVESPGIVAPAFRTGASGLSTGTDSGALTGNLAAPLAGAGSWTALGVFEPGETFFDPASTVPGALWTLPGYVQVSGAAGLLRLSEVHPEATEAVTVTTAEAFSAPVEREAWGAALVGKSSEELVTLQIGPLSDWPARTRTLSLTLPQRTRALTMWGLGAGVTNEPGSVAAGLAALHGVWILDDSAFSEDQVAHYFETVAPLWQPGEPLVPEVTITTPSANSRYAAPAVIHLGATVTENGSPVRQVAFYKMQDGVESLLGIDTAAPFEGFWRVKRNDTYFITAKATDANGATATSDPRIIIVNDTPGSGNTAPNFRPGFNLVGPAQVSQPSPLRPVTPGGPGSPKPGGPNQGGPGGPGPGNNPQNTGDDLDGDGRNNDDDWVDYDRSLNAWGRTGVPRFAVIETGAFIPWRSNKFGMVLGYKGTPEPQSEWYVWYKGEWAQNKIVVSALGVNEPEMLEIPVLSQEHPVAYGLVRGKRAVGCENEEQNITVGYVFDADTGMHALEESAPSGADPAGIGRELKATVNGFSGSVEAVKVEGSGSDCTQRIISTSATWTLGGRVSAFWDDDDDPDNGDPEGNSSSNGEGFGQLPIEQCTPEKVPVDPPAIDPNPPRPETRPDEVRAIGRVNAVTSWRICDKDSPSDADLKRQIEEFKQAWSEAAETYNAEVDAWTEEKPCPRFNRPPSPGGALSGFNVPASGSYHFNGKSRPAVTHPQLETMGEALTEPVVYATNPDLVSVLKGRWDEGGFGPHSKCLQRDGEFTQDRRVLWLTHGGKNEFTKLRDGRGGLTVDIGQFSVDRTFTVGQNGLGGLWADGRVYPWTELTGGKSILAWNWYVGREGLSCARGAGGGMILVPVEIVIMKSETSTDAEWEDDTFEWKMRTGGQFGRWKPFNFDDGDSFMLKLVSTMELSQEIVDEIEFELAAFNAEPTANPNWIKLAAKDFGRLSPDKKEIWCMIPAAKIKSDVLPPEKPDSTSIESFSFDFPTTGSFIDSDAYDAEVDADTDKSVNARLLGNWEDKPATTPEGEIDPWTAAVGKEFIVHGGGIYIAARFGSAEEERAVAKNQVDWMYLSTHGHSDTGTIDVGVGESIVPADVEWQEDLDIVIIAGCSVLDVNDYNGNYDDDNADGDNDRSTGKEAGPSSKVFNGEKWATTGPKYLLGYNYNAPLDSQNSDKIIKDWASNRATLGVIEAWMDANDNSNGRNACAIEVGIGYWYFTDVFHVLKFVPASEW